MNLSLTSVKPNKDVDDVGLRNCFRWKMVFEEDGRLFSTENYCYSTEAK